MLVLSLCLIASSQSHKLPLPDLTAPRCSGAMERSWWLTLEFGGVIVHSIPQQGIGAAHLGIWPLAKLISPILG